MSDLRLILPSMIGGFLSGRTDSWSYTIIHPEYKTEVRIICWQRRRKSLAEAHFRAYIAPAYILRSPLPFITKIMTEWRKQSTEDKTTIGVKWIQNMGAFQIEWLRIAKEIA